MHDPAYSLNTLFAQLGLDSSDAAIERFIGAYPPIPPTQPLWQAPCWSPAQALLLKESIGNDADWSDVVDQLDSLLRKQPQDRA